MDAQDATDTNRVESPFVDQPADRLGMDTELVRDFANADEGRLLTRRRHASDRVAGPADCCMPD